MKVYIFIFFAFIIDKYFAQPVFSGAHAFGDQNSGCWNMLIKHDSRDQLYTCGNFFNQVDFSTASPPVTFTNSGLFVCKYGKYNNLIWARCLPTGNNSAISYISIDNEGSVLLFGRVHENIDCDPGPGVFSIYGGYTYQGYATQDLFLCKLDSNGKFLWANQYGGPPQESCGGMDLDDENNIYISGIFQDTIDLDPGNAYLAGESGFRGSAMFLQKLNKDGKMKWSKVMPLYAYSRSTALTVDKNHEITLGGQFYLDLDLDPGPNTFTFTTGYAYKVFLARYDTAGNLSWAREFVEGWLDDMRGDNLGNVYFTGSFSSGDFDPGPGTYSLSAAGINDIYLTKIDQSGNLVYTKTFPGKGSDQASDLFVDRDKNIFLAGTIGDTCDLDPGNGQYLLSPANGTISSIFVNKIDSLGNFICAGVVNSKAYNFVNSMSVDNVGNIFLCGAISDTADVDMGAGTHFLGTQYFQGIFISKSNCGLSYTSVEETSFSNNLLRIFPVPVESELNISVEKISDGILRIYDVTGKIIFEEPHFQSDYQADLKHFSGGIYFVELTSENSRLTRKIIKN